MRTNNGNLMIGGYPLENIPENYSAQDLFEAIKHQYDKLVTSLTISYSIPGGYVAVFGPGSICIKPDEEGSKRPLEAYVQEHLGMPLSHCSYINFEKEQPAVTYEVGCGPC